jgi:hypothetical protein
MKGNRILSLGESFKIPPKAEETAFENSSLFLQI